MKDVLFSCRSLPESSGRKLAQQMDGHESIDLQDVCITYIFEQHMVASILRQPLAAQ